MASWFMGARTWPLLAHFMQARINKATGTSESHAVVLYSYLEGAGTNTGIVFAKEDLLNQ